MKKILSPTMKGRGAERLAMQLKHRVETDAEVAALNGEIQVPEAWALSEDRVKARVEVRLPDGTLPPESAA